MHYRINESIIYTPDDGTLKLIDNNNRIYSGEISLAPTANRLLAMLISHHGSILQRDELLDNVWDAHGLRASNNSLNQYISVLRRNFSDIGVEDTVIITIPTVGFMFSKDISVISENIPPDIKNTPIKNAPLDTQIPPEETKSSFWERRKKGIVLSLLAVLTVANYWYLMPSQSTGPAFEKRYLLGMLDSCPVYTFYQTPESSTQSYMELVRKSMDKANFHCRGFSEIFFKVEDLALHREKATMFIAICSRLEENSYSNCRSYYTN